MRYPCHLGYPGHAASTVAAIPPPTDQATAPSIKTPAGKYISRVRAGTSAATVTTGLFAALASSSAITTSARNACGAVERYRLQPSITSSPKHMGVPMTIRTLKACAGLATAARRQRIDCDELPTMHILRFTATHESQLPAHL